jgi:lipopolysaccharide transport system ATP-binding protein
VTGVAIAAEGLSKVYRVYRRPLDRLVEAVVRKPRHSAVAALHGVSFAVPAGEGIGIIGENGAGKSTLLKILSGVTAPTTGTYRIDGKVAAILELGAGFHPEFTGRQNAHLNAALLGLSEAEVAAAVPRIVDFSELGDFIDRPVKTYSTGMGMRLAFSIATQVDPRVLIVDEALAVGDGYFQKKCLDRLLAFIDGGGTVLFCSHAMYYVSSLCRHALWLRGGEVERFGPALEVVDAYESFLVKKQPAAPAGGTTRPPAAERRGPVRLTGVRWLPDGRDVRAETGRAFRQGEPWALEVAWESADPGRGVHVAVGIDRTDGVQVCAFATHTEGRPPLDGRRGSIALRVPSLPIVKGELTLYVFLLDEEGLHVWDQAVVPGAFRVALDTYRAGLVAVEHFWDERGVPTGSDGGAAAVGKPSAEAIPR